MPRSETITLDALRRRAVAAQRFAPDAERARPADVAAAVRRLSCVQLDSIATVDRSHRIALSGRVGALPEGVETRLLRSGRVFEYWAHEACLVPVEDYPLMKHRMRARRVHHWWGPVIDKDPALAERVLDAVRERGPLASRDFGGGGGRGMWELKPAKRMLDALWTAGELAIAGRNGFERVYDLPERVIPRKYLDAPAPDEAATLRGLVRRAVEARGALTLRGVIEHYRLSGGVARIRPHVDALVEEGVLRRLAVEDGGADVLVPARARVLDRHVPHEGVLLSPFENLLWDRAFAERVFGFRHIIEVYKRAHERAFGYYVLPFLVGDRLVGRADLKADRPAGTLRVRAFHLERGERDTRAVRAAFKDALARLAARIGVEDVDASDAW